MLLGAFIVTFGNEQRGNMPLAFAYQKGGENMRELMSKDERLQRRQGYLASRLRQIERTRESLLAEQWLIEQQLMRLDDLARNMRK